MSTQVTKISSNNSILSPNQSKLVTFRELTRNFGASEDYVEMNISDPSGRNLFNVVPFKNYQIPGVFQPSTAYTINELVFDPATDLKNLGVSLGDYRVQYNILRPKVNLTTDRVFFIKEISANRTEIRLFTNNIPNAQIDTNTSQFISDIQGLPYFKEFYINFGNNKLLPAVNIALDRNTLPYSIIIKLLNPLPIEYKTLDLVSIVDEIANPQVFEVNIEPEPVQVTFPTLRGPNFDLDLDNLRIGSTPYYNFNNIFNSFTSSVSVQLQSILGNLSSSEATINVDYADFDNFVHFSSANRRLENFEYKLTQIETFTSASASAVASSTPGGAIDATLYQNKLNKVLQSFDGYEQYLYFESASYAWPKYNSTKPYLNYSVSSSQGIVWFASASVSASLYDDNNQNYLLYALPGYIGEDVNNEEAFKFVATIGQVFDDIWIHIKAITDLYKAKNKLSEGISKDIVYFALQSLGINPYTDEDQTDIFNYLYGVNANGSYLPTTSSYQTLVSGSQYSISGQDQIKSIYKRIYNNLPLLLKSKGTTRFVQYLNTIYGTPNTIMSYLEYGGVDKVTSSFEYEYDRFTYALNLSSSNTVNIPWTYLSQSAAKTGFNDIVADGVELRFQAYPTTTATQSLFYNSSNFKLNLLYTNTGSVDSAYSASTGEFGYFQFTLGSTSITSSTVPVFTTSSKGETNWYSVLVQRRTPNVRLATTSSSQTYDIYVKNNVYGEVGHVASASLTTTTQNASWYTGGTTLTLGGGSTPFSGSIQEVRLWSNYISESAFNSHVLNPSSIEGNYTSSAFNDLAVRFTLGNNLYTYNHSLTSSVYSTHPDQKTQILSASFSNFPNKNNYVSFTEAYYADVANSGLANPVTDKVRIVSSSAYGNVLLSHRSIEQQPVLPTTKDIHLLDAGLSPQDEINKDIIAQLGSTYDLDAILGNPTGKGYNELIALRNDYFKKYTNKYNYKDFINLIQYFHNSLFRTLKDFIPARTDLSTGIIIKPHLLERSTVDIPNPEISLHNNLSQSINTAFIEGSSGNDYSASLYPYKVLGALGFVSMSSNGGDFFTGEITGSYIDVYSNFIGGDQNPFLKFKTENTVPFSQSIWNYDYNPLLNNVSSGISSQYIKKKEFQNPTSSVTTSIDLQDFTYDYQRHIRPRYNGSSTTSTNINFFTADDANFGLNKPYGKNATIDQNTNKFAFFSEATCTGSQQIAMPERTNLYLKYLIDEKGKLTELTRRDYEKVDDQQRYNLYEVQNIFKSGETLNIGLFDNQNPSRQKPLDGNKFIFQGGYRFFPTLWRITGSNQVYTLNDAVYPGGLSTDSATNTSNYNASTDYRQITVWFSPQTVREIYVTYTPPSPGDYLPFDVIVKVRVPIFLGNDDYFDVTIPRANANGTPNYTGYLRSDANGWRYTDGPAQVISVTPAGNSSAYIFDYVDDNPYLTVHGNNKSIISCSADMSAYYFYPSNPGGWFYSGSTLNTYANAFCPPEYPFQLNVGDIVRFATSSGSFKGFLPQEEYTILEVYPQPTLTSRVTFRLDRAINPKITGSNANRIDYYVFSRKIADETNVIVNVKKNPGQTSGGIVKNLNLVKRVDDDLANLVSDLKSKIFSTVLVQ
jgi:hypothetical protein